MFVLLAVSVVTTLRFSMMRNHGMERGLLFFESQPQQSSTTDESSELIQCLAALPDWVHRGPRYFQEAMWNASQGKTDKVGNPVNRRSVHSHEYQLLYWPYLSKLVQRKQCLEPQEQREPLRFLEIGLGCNPERVAVGGSALAWHALFHPHNNSYNTAELYILEYDEACARAWERENPAIVTNVFTGDASSSVDWQLILQQVNQPFDVIVDDGSHINDHQVFALELLLKDWIAPGGLYIVEDIESSCFNWPANVGKPERGPGTGGTRNCLVQANGKPTILGKLLDYHKELMHWKKGGAPLGGTVTHVDIHWGAAVIEKKLDY